MRLGRPVEYDLEQVLDAAMDEFWRRGYQATSLKHLMNATTLSKSSLYQVFGSKHALFIRCLERYQDQTTADLWRRLESAPSGIQFIDDTLMWVIEEAKRTEQPQGCLVMNTASEIAQGDAEIADCVTLGLDKYRTIFRHAIERAQKEGAVSSGRDSKLLANYFVANMSGLRTMVKAGTNTGSLKKMITIVMQALN